MDETDLLVAETLLLLDPELFKHYLVDLSPEESSRHQEAEDIFKRFHHPSPFDCFVKDYQKYCQDKKKREKVQSSTQTNQAADTSQDREGPRHRETLQSFAMPEPWETRTRLTVVPPFRKRRRPPKESFNVAEFLLQKKRNEETSSLKFMSDEDIQEELSQLEELPENKKHIFISNGMLKKLADQIELFNQIHSYRVLEVYYDHETY